MREKIFKVSALMSVALLLCGMVSSCVHEWPDELTPADVDVNLEFNTEFLPLKDVEYTKKNIHYQISTFETLKCANLYAFVHERSFTLSKESSYVGLIEQLSAVGTDSMSDLRDLLLKRSRLLYYGVFPERPKSVFDGVCIAVAIVVSKVGIAMKNSRLFSSGICRSNEDSRKVLFQNLSSAEINRELFLSRHNLFPKYRLLLETVIANKILSEDPIDQYTTKFQSSNFLSYRTAGGRYWKIVINRRFSSDSTSNKVKYITRTINSSVLVALLNSNLMWWYYANYFDLYNFKDYMIFSFPFAFDDEVSSLMPVLKVLGEELMQSYEKNKETATQFIKSRNQIAVFETFNPKYSKTIIDKIDELLAKHYGFTEEELDFIINYDIKYRMGDELNKND